MAERLSRKLTYKGEKTRKKGAGERQSDRVQCPS